MRPHLLNELGDEHVPKPDCIGCMAAQAKVKITVEDATLAAIVLLRQTPLSDVMRGLCESHRKQLEREVRQAVQRMTPKPELVKLEGKTVGFETPTRGKIRGS